jgi:hypothetical protein
VMNDAGGFSYAALAAMVTVGFCEGVTK